MNNIRNDLMTAFESSGLTYDELAKQAQVPKSALYRYLNGDTEKIPIDRFQSICAVLHIDAKALLGWTSDDVPPPAPPDEPQTSEARILAKGIDKLPKEQREQALAVVRAMFAKYADYFEKENEDDA